MATLQDSLLSLSATTWDSLPSDEAALREYITTLRTKARLIIDSVPEPPASDNTKKYETSVGTLKLRPSPVRLQTKNKSTLDSQKEWGKPVAKQAVSKDNPLSVPVYKLSGSDGQGSWFGRRSVHAGLEYRVWEEKLSSEIGETLRKNEERIEGGLDPDVAVRGIGAQSRLESVEIRSEDGESVVAKLNVYHVSASFPRPTTSRDFVIMIVTWEAGFDHPEEEKNGKEEREGRSWMMVSRPVEHPDAPSTEQYIRGQYESVEMIREIIVEKDSSDADGAKDEPNPVEWIMVTRSDPGGTIPRWMVEKGTPKSICGDAAKFVEWASQDLEAETQAAATKERERLQSFADSKSKDSQAAIAVDESDSDSSSDLSYYDPEERHGLIASVGHLLNAGLERYAPQAVLDYIPQQSHSRQSSYTSRLNDSRDLQSTPTRQNKTATETETDAQETLSQTSISLASDVPTGPNTPGPSDINLDTSAAELFQRSKKGKLSSAERQLAKLAQEKRSVEAQLDLVRSDIHSLGLRAPEDKDKEKDEKDNRTSAKSSVDNPTGASDQPLDTAASATSSTSRLPSSDQTSSSKNRSRANTPTTNTDNPEMNKVASALFREESKLIRRLSKIERHQIKEAAKVEEKQRKEAEKQDKARSRGETDALKSEVESLKKEIDKLRGERKQWLGLIKALQAENTKLAREKRNGEEGK
ncbi:uncharacterized protein BDV17DRAFT_24225 [Aspergillus undulatus]|uniref:uncharacterized protein n=1 Tax=Aspergillus undulatus TaxID=1810928 RepID=UPI003CCCBC78